MRRSVNHPRGIGQRRGFALVLTVSILVLLAVIAVGLLTLSSVAVRSSTLGDAQAQARANARVALMLAIGELQRSVGPDGRITAPATLLDADPETEEAEGVGQRFLTGVWEARTEELGTQPNYDREVPFRRWLVSSADPEAVGRLAFAEEDAPSGSVPMVVSPSRDGSGSPDVVTAGTVDTEQGAYAWWVGDENTKGHIGIRDELDREGGPKVADLLASQATPGGHGLQAVAGFEGFPTNTDVSDRVVSRGLVELAEDGTPLAPAHYHDLTPHSESVLANVTKGSLRKDLSLFLEREDIEWLDGWGAQEGQSREPDGPLGPNGQIALSPPDEYDVLSWKSLHHWASMHRRQLGQGPFFPVKSMRNYTSSIDPVDNPAWNSGVLRLSPVMVRMQMVLSYGVREKSDTGSGRGEKLYDLFMYSYPVLTMWNPYSVALEVDQWSVFLHTLPLEHTIYKNGLKHNVTGSGSRNGNYNWGWPAGNMVMRFGDAGTPGVKFEPGEAKIMTYITSSAGGFHAHDMVEGVQPWLPPGRDPNGHVGQPRHLGTISARPTDRISIETKGSSWDTSLNSYNQFQTTFGFRCEPKAVHRGHPPRFRQQMFCGQVCWRREVNNGNPVADFISKSNFPSQTFQGLDNAPAPFIHLDVRLKTLDEVQLPVKTWLHTLPAHPYVSATSTEKHGRQGVDAATTFFAHPYTVVFEQINGLEGVVQNQPFFGPSNRPGGRGRIVAQDIPLVPLTSLAQLQNLPQYPMEGLNWSGYYFQNHAIGNSYASPGLPPADVRQRSFPFYLGEYFAWQGGDIAGKFYNNWTWFNNADYTIRAAPASVVDRSYAANHLLFDDYFFSSMSAQKGDIFRNYGEERFVQQVVREFYEGEAPLPNPAYRPHLGGLESDEVIRALTASRSGVPRDAHERAAAHLMVTGGFNVNSTSVPAWTTLLASSHLKRPVTYSGRGGLVANERARFVVSRFNAPLGGSAGSEPGSEDERWLGYRELTQDEVRELAEAIVRQVKTRGPFRSLGEFVNRRLSSDTDLARYGALQAALEDPAVSINDNYRSEEITPGDLGGRRGANYKFPEAALGSRYQGTPAYISQADILTPIAPVLNARSDTFVVRAYGEARSADGREVLARAWCEAVVQRTPDYLDPADLAWTPRGELTSEANKAFGRRFFMKAFRWISPDEVETAGGAA